jgi:phosphoribosylanthranilate isomerase
MTWVKICGTTNLEDALTAVEAGADAVGFVFCKGSPRNIGIEWARQIVAKLPPGIEKIGVFLNGIGPNPLDVMLQVGLTGTQTYISEEGNARSSGFRGIGPGLLPKNAKFIVALPWKLFGKGAIAQRQNLTSDFVEWRKSLPEGTPIPEGLFNTFLLDSGDLRHPGGTGKTFDWQQAAGLAEGMRRVGTKLVVAGGLTAANVGQAMAVLKPWGVDVVSGVEDLPGKKDPEKVRAFVEAVREIDRKTN